MLRVTLLRLLVLLAVIVSATFAGDNGSIDRDLNKYPVRFAIIGDRTGEAQEGIYEKIVAEVERLKPEFVMTVGDQIEGYTSDTAQLGEEWREYLDIIKSLSAPVYLTPGNHDITYDDMEETYRQYTGRSPYYSFDYDGLHIVILDNSRWYNSDEMPVEQIEWLTADLKAKQNANRTLVFCHVPFWYRTLADNKPDTLHSIFRTYGVDAVICGHWHAYFVGEFDGIKYTCIGTSGGDAEFRPGAPECHFAWVTVSEDDIAIAPVAVNSVLAWDAVSVEDERYYQTSRLLGISFANVAPVIESQLKVEKTPITVEVHNFSDERTLADTVRWTVPETWKVEPEDLFVEVPAGETGRFEFEVACDSNIYPLPEVSVAFPFGVDGECPASKELRIARYADCIMAESPPVIDGAINEDVWRSYYGGLLSGEGKPSSVDSSEFYFAYDAANLYLGVVCYETKMDSIVADMTEHDDAIYAEDCVGFLYRPLAPVDAVYQLYVNPIGTTFDQKIQQASDGYWVDDQLWDGEYEVATSRGDGTWMVEVRIPLDQFGALTETGMEWDFNFRRKQRRLNDAGGWQIPHAYDPNGFGKLVFR